MNTNNFRRSASYERKAYTLVEVIIVIAIIAVLISLLLPAISKIRSASLRTQSQNHLRQIGLSFHMAIADNSNHVPGLLNPERSHEGASQGDKDPFGSILPYTEGAGSFPYYFDDPPFGLGMPLIKVFLSPTDFTIDKRKKIPFARFERCGPTSYAANMHACSGNPMFPGSFVDGTSNTIAFSEGYHDTQKRSNLRIYQGPHIRIGTVQHPYPFDYTGDTSTFANVNHFEVYPVTRGNPAFTTSNVPGITFQLTPSHEESDGRQLQATQSNGLLVAMFDGSVRTIGPQVSESSFWSLVTRSGGEVLIPD
jgi:prepilin-type N-terminal cleavage/methylation domain-containing protein